MTIWSLYLSKGGNFTGRAEQKEERHRQILETALDLFVKKGFAATRVVDIAEAAGISKGLMFNYFSSKEELYKTLVNIGMSKSMGLLESYSGDALEFFTHAAKIVINGAKQNSFTAKMFVLMNDASRGDFLSDKIRYSLMHDNIAKSAEFIAKGQQQGTIRRGNPYALASTFWGAVSGVCQMAVQDSDFIYPEPEWIVSIIKKDD